MKITNTFLTFRNIIISAIGTKIKKINPSLILILFWFYTVIFKTLEITVTMVMNNVKPICYHI